MARIASWLSLAALVAAAAGCTHGQLLSEAASTLQVWGRQVEEQRSFLGLSTLVFYPDGVPEDMARLPELGEAQLQQIRKDLERQAAQLLATAQEQRPLISSALGREAQPVAKQRVRIEHRGGATAFVDAAGTITLDVKVVQGVYRGILLSSVEEADAGSGEDLAARQRRGLQELIDARNRFLGMAASPTAGTVAAAAEATRAHGLSWEAAMAALDSRMADWFAASRSTRASKEYDDALAFLLGHEIGHRALGHYRRREGGEALAALELEADRYAALLVALSRNRWVTPDDDYRWTGPPPGRMTLTMGEVVCLLDTHHRPSGHLSFFAHGYELAGFDSLAGAGSASHPDPASRARAARAVTSAALWGIDEAQTATGTCHTTAAERTAYAAQPIIALDESLSRARQMAGDHAGQQLQLAEMLAEHVVMRQVYLDFFARLDRTRRH